MRFPPGRKVPPPSRKNPSAGSPPLSPCGLFCAQMLQCESFCCGAIRLARGFSICVERIWHDSVWAVANRGRAMADMGIGYFGDERLRKNGALFAERVSERQDVCIRGLADNRSEQVRLRRFLHNEAVTVEEMVAHRAMLTATAASGRHVLAIQDTSEINYQAQSGRKQRLGTVGNGSDVGLFIHPVLAVDAEAGECLGLVDAQVWRRTKGKAKDYRRLPIEQKESYRWLRGGDQAKAVLGEAAMVTVLDDREGDIYEKWARLPDARTQLLTRASQDRNLADGGQLFATLAGLAEAHRYEFELAARPGKRSARKAVMAVRFAPVRIRRPLHCSDAAAPAEIELFAIEVRELDAPAGEEPVLWRLLTTHRLLAGG